VLIHDLLPLFAALAADDQDSVRHLTVADLIAIAQQLNPQETQELLGTGIRNLWADKSWRVRYSVADNWVALAMAVGGDHAGEELVAAFVRLVKDNEAEVRSAIAKQIPGIHLPFSFSDFGRILQVGSSTCYFGRDSWSDQRPRERSQSSS
jgi:serine/threonine-protein phosphatase 2A regulatory subunit A